MITHTGGRVRNRRYAAARTDHPASSSLVVPTTSDAEAPSAASPAQPAPAAQPTAAVPRAGAPALGVLSAPALALLAAAAIFEGYRWLHLVPGRPSASDTVLFASVAVAITVALTRPAVWTRTGTVRRAVRLSSYTVIGLALLVRVVGGSATDRLLGTTSLVLAAAALSGAVLGGRRRRPDDPGGSAQR